MNLMHCTSCHHEWETGKDTDHCDWCHQPGHIIDVRPAFDWNHMREWIEQRVLKRSRTVRYDRNT